MSKRKNILALPQMKADPTGHTPKMVATKLNKRQGTALKALLQSWYGVESCEISPSLGRRPVSGYGNAVRKLLDLVADSMENGQELREKEPS